MSAPGGQEPGKEISANDGEEPDREIPVSGNEDPNWGTSAPARELGWEQATWVEVDAILLGAVAGTALIIELLLL